LVKVDKSGAETTLDDDDDGRHDGRVVVSLDPSPIFLRFD
jgi:hypothetical protein